MVPSNTTVGVYTVTITPTGTKKAIKDVESFSVPGYFIQVTAVNLAGQDVTGIIVQALDKNSGTVYSGTSGSNGIVDLSLEKGVCTLTALWNGTLSVGETSITVTGNATVTLQCKLTDLKIVVQNENEIPLSSVNLAISYQYQLTSGASQTGNVSAQTGS